MTGPEKYKLEHISFECGTGCISNQFLIDFVKASVDGQLSLSLKDVNVFNTQIKLDEIASDLSEIDSLLKVTNTECSPNYVQKHAA